MTKDARRRALVVEDELPVRDLLRLHLELAGFEVEESADGRDALRRLRENAYNLVILDVMLPGLDGVSLCRAIRTGGPNVSTPILMLTARDTESDKVLGLESGADDYLTKPFGIRELIARVNAITRRHARDDDSPAPAQKRTSAANVQLDPERREAIVRGTPIELTRQEFDLLYQLARRAWDRLQPGSIAPERLERRHLRHGTHCGYGHQQAAPEDRARPAGSRADPDRLGSRL